VGFYLKNGLSYKIVNELSPFEEKIFESLTICAAHIGMDGIRIEKEPRQRDECVNRIS
jgi:hypothetical protein